MEGILVPIVFFVMVAAVVIVPRYLKSLEKQKLNDTLRAAIERGATLPPEVIEALTSDVKKRSPPSAQRDLRGGVIWLAIAVGIMAFGYAMSFEEPDMLYGSFAFAAIPGFVGLALIALSFIGRDKQ